MTYFQTYSNAQKVPIIYNCKICNYNTSRKSHYERHILTRKHEILTKGLTLTKNKVPERNWVCNCGKEYLHKQSLYKHKKTCSNSEKLNENNMDTIKNEENE